MTPELLDFINELLDALDNANSEVVDATDEIHASQRAADRCVDNIRSLIKSARKAPDNEVWDYLDDIDTDIDEIESQLADIYNENEKIISDGKIDTDDMRKRLEILKVKAQL